MQQESEPEHNLQFSLAWKMISGTATGGKTPLPAALRRGWFSCSWTGHFSPQQYHVPRSGALVIPPALGIRVNPRPPWRGSTARQGWQGDGSLAHLLVMPEALQRPERDWMSQGRERGASGGFPATFFLFPPPQSYCTNVLSFVPISGC